MRNWKVIVDKKEYKGSVPADWNEMDEKRFNLLVWLADGGISAEDFFSSYFGLPKKVLAKLDMFTVYTLGSLLLSINEKVMMNKFIIPTVKLGKNVFVSPTEGLTGMTFQQFISIDTYYTWYIQLKQKEYLVGMAVCMYLKEGEGIQDFDAEERNAIWQQAQDIVLNCLLTNWTFVKCWLAKCYPYLFAGGGSDTTPGKKVKPSNAWSEIMDSLVEDDLTRIESYKKLECMDVIRILNRRIKEQREMKK